MNIQTINVKSKKCCQMALKIFCLNHLTEEVTYQVSCRGITFLKKFKQGPSHNS